MAKTGFTAGPTTGIWKYRRFSNGPNSNGAVYDERGKAVASLVHAKNGPLIAAAPDLLEATERILVILDEGIGEAVHEDRWFARQGIDKLRAAIAKALGTTDVKDSVRACPCGSGWKGIGVCPDCKREHGRIV